MPALPAVYALAHAASEADRLALRPMWPGAALAFRSRQGRATSRRDAAHEVIAATVDVQREHGRCEQLVLDDPRLGVYRPCDARVLLHLACDAGFTVGAVVRTPVVKGEREVQRLGEEDAQRAPERGLRGVAVDVLNEALSKRPR